MPSNVASDSALVPRLPATRRRGDVAIDRNVWDGAHRMLAVVLQAEVERISVLAMGGELMLPMHLDPQVFAITRQPLTEPGTPDKRKLRVEGRSARSEREQNG